MIEHINEFLSHNITGTYGAVWSKVIILAGIAAVAVAAFFITEGTAFLLKVLIDKSRTTWDDDLLNTRFLKAISQLAPAMAVWWLLPQFFTHSDTALTWIGILTRCYILWTVVYIISITVGNLYHAFLKRDNLRVYAIKGMFQTVKLVVIIMGVILTVSILAEKSPVAILTAIGASAAILMLVFKDTILGLVASVQLTANHMLERGDWVVVEKHGANGEVIDVSLTTVKVRNWDNSVTTVPPYSLVSESFRNYQPMRDSGGRRVERPIYIDVNSVRFCTRNEREALAARGWIEADTPDTAVNLGLLRSYIENYLLNDHRVNSDMTIMVRQMEPTPSGLPLQLYFFTVTTEWKEYEHVQSDIFDHVYASIHEFGLRIFQTPAGTDINNLRQ